jgi:hypothetical protein
MRESAHSNHPWKNQTGDLEGAIQIAEFAHQEGPGVVGTWGVKAGEKGLNYALIHELGGVIVPVRAKALKIPQPDGSIRLVKTVTIPPRPYLRPAADATYPSLVANIRKAFEGSGGGTSGDLRNATEGKAADEFE